MRPSQRSARSAARKVLTGCASCGAPIQGHYIPPGVPPLGDDFPHRPFVLRVERRIHGRKIAAARALTDELEGLSDEDRGQLKAAIEQVATEGPTSEVAAARLKRILGKASSAVGQALWKVTVDVAREAAKKIMLGQ